MGDEADVLEVLPFVDVHDIRDVSVEIDVFDGEGRFGSRRRTPVALPALRKMP